MNEEEQFLGSLAAFYSGERRLKRERNLEREGLGLLFLLGQNLNLTFLV